MAYWKDFELECLQYLNDYFSEYAIFKYEGGSNSKVSDIKVVLNDGRFFYIDVKSCPAHCGQFVLIPNVIEKNFNYSKLNAQKLNKYSEEIVSHMNKNFDYYKDSGTAGRQITLENDNIFYNWIIDYYKQKKVKFIITNNKIIIPLNEIKKYFYVSAIYRIKRSGSSSVGARKIDAILDFLKSKEYKIENIMKKGPKIFIKSDRVKHNEKFIFDKNEYMFSKKDSEELNFEIRKLSNTFNANVIFSLKLKDKKNIDFNFKEYIQKY